MHAYNSNEELDLYTVVIHRDRIELALDEILNSIRKGENKISSIEFAGHYMRYTMNLYSEEAMYIKLKYSYIEIFES